MRLTISLSTNLVYVYLEHYYRCVRMHAKCTIPRQKSNNYLAQLLPIRETPLPKSHPLGVFSARPGPLQMKILDPPMHPANFGLPRPFRSRVRSKHATDRQTDRHHFVMPPLYEGRGITIELLLPIIATSTVLTWVVRVVRLRVLSGSSASI